MGLLGSKFIARSLVLTSAGFVFSAISVHAMNSGESADTSHLHASQLSNSSIKLIESMSDAVASEVASAKEFCFANNRISGSDVVLIADQSSTAEQSSSTNSQTKTVVQVKDNATDKTVVESKSQTTSTATNSSNTADHVVPTKSSHIVNATSQPGILSQSQQQTHQPGLLSRALGGVMSDAAHATMALVGTTILNQGVDLPPDDASSPEWPFREPHRKAMYYVDWADGSQAKISRLPDGSLQILGGGRRYTMQPEGEGSFALMGDYGSMATVTPRPGGGYMICKADGTVEQVLPRQGGGFTITGRNGVIATILPGVAGKKHVIRGRSFSSGFIQ